MKINFDSSLSFESPIGAINIFAHDNKVVYLEMAQPAVENTGKASVLKDAKRQLQKYFAGDKVHFDLALQLDGTDFQVAVWNTIAKIPFGEVMTYGEIAQAIDNPAAVRAVGGAVGSNPVALIIGCHRVLGSNQKITGYSGGRGIETKEWLLRHEKIEFKN